MDPHAEKTAGEKVSLVNAHKFFFAKSYIISQEREEIYDFRPLNQPFLSVVAASLDEMLRFVSCQLWKKPELNVMGRN